MRVVKEGIWRLNVQILYQNTYEKILIKAPGIEVPTIAQDYTMTMASTVQVVGLTKVVVTYITVTMTTMVRAIDIKKGAMAVRQTTKMAMVLEQTVTLMQMGIHEGQDPEKDLVKGRRVVTEKVRGRGVDRWRALLFTLVIMKITIKRVQIILVAGRLKSPMIESKVSQMQWAVTGLHDGMKVPDRTKQDGLKTAVVTLRMMVVAKMDANQGGLRSHIQVITLVGKEIGKVVEKQGGLKAAMTMTMTLEVVIIESEIDQVTQMVVRSFAGQRKIANGVEETVESRIMENMYACSVYIKPIIVLV